jgi:hypothetical protein
MCNLGKAFKTSTGLGRIRGTNTLSSIVLPFVTNHHPKTINPIKIKVKTVELFPLIGSLTFIFENLAIAVRIRAKQPTAMKNPIMATFLSLFFIVNSISEIYSMSIKKRIEPKFYPLFYYLTDIIAAQAGKP